MHIKDPNCFSIYTLCRSNPDQVHCDANALSSALMHYLHHSADVEPIQPDIEDVEIIAEHITGLISCPCQACEPVSFLSMCLRSNNSCNL